jgi:hypothetical protein
MMPALSPASGFPFFPDMAVTQPNEVDFHRIRRGLERRKRYRYAQPEIHCIADGYEIVSTCSSRTVDPQGGVIDIARLIYQHYAGIWELYRKDHDIGLWILHGEYLGLPRVIDILNEDFDRRFWQ